MGRRKFTREFKVEAVGLVRERGMTMAQVAGDLDLQATLLSKKDKSIRLLAGRAQQGHEASQPETKENAGL